MKSYRVRERHHDNLLDDLLIARGVPASEHERFLNPDYLEGSHDPYLLPDMEPAVKRIIAAIEGGEHMAVWSDYDCDGIPGGVMLTDFLRTAGGRVTHYIPHRHKEGYGLNPEGLSELATKGVSLIITVDLGTTDVASVACARSLGVEVIVTDHHIAPAVLPESLVINPKRAGSKYPFGGLCGAGVAWKLVQAILSKNRPEGFTEGREKWYLDLVGLATLSDMVPLVGENRMLAYFGLKVMRRAQRPGLAALFSLLRIKPATLTEDDIAFMVAPRINAASRMDAPDTAAQLLAATSATDAAALARTLNKINDERKGAVAATVKEVNKRLTLGGVESPVIVMGSPHWRPGVLGLVANSLMEAHGKPVCLWGMEGGEVIRGSCRSPSVNVVELLHAAGDVFDDFGGHSASGGFSLAHERVHELPGRLSRAYGELAARAFVAPEVVVDRELSLEELPLTRRELARIAPFGVGNEKPLFVFPYVSIASARTFGKEQNHLELGFARGSSVVSGVSFFSTPDSFSKKVSKGERADIVGHIESDWRGQPRIRIVDIV